MFFKAVRPRAHDVPSQAQRSTGCSSRARPEDSGNEVLLINEALELLLSIDPK